MYDNTDNPTRVVLAAVDTGTYAVDDSLAELEELANTAGAEVAALFVQNRQQVDKATFIGSGRLEEIRQFCLSNEIDLIIFDDELTAAQTKNIEKITEIRVIDRTTLILDIFAGRAHSAEGRLQVELAQQRYRLPRLAGMGVELSRLGGGIGTRGPGETKLEADRRHIRRRVKTLEKELEALQSRRMLQRQRRKKNNITSVAIVGYTNAGKSTLLNSLTNAGVLAENKLFATLDPTARALELPSGKSVLLIDTVGFISRLPHHLVEAFKSTLEEAQNADLILHVCDVSNEHVTDQIQVCEQLLEELECGSIPVLTVLNKCDKIPHQPDFKDTNSVLISAKTGFGFDNLLKSIDSALNQTSRRMELLIPYDQTGFIAKIRMEGKVFQEEYTDEGVIIDALVDHKLFYLAENYIFTEK